MAADKRAYPFSAFNFEIQIRKEGEAAPLCNAAFSECDGLEVSMDVKTIRQGGDNQRQLRFAGAAAYAPLTLKRGMTQGFDLWRWFSQTIEDPGLRAEAEVILFAADGTTEQVRFALSRCIPVKLKAPPLNAREGVVAIEELQVAYETLALKAPKPKQGAQP